MSEGACISFQQHAWKTDMCANCLKAKSWHEADCASRRPMPAKRQSREPTAILSKTDDTKVSEVDNVMASDSIQKSFKSENNVISIGTSERIVMCKESIGASTTAKPSPIKAKPAIGSKPIMPQKPVGFINEDSEVLSSKCSSSVQRPRNVLSSENVPNSDENGDDKQVRNFSECNASDHIISDCLIADHSLEKQTSHYYQVYDITARNEVTVTSTSGNECNASSKPSRIAGNKRVPAMQIVEEQIAMPYNVVDVTIRRPDASGCLPQLPRTPAPSNSVSQPVLNFPATSINNSPVPRQRTAKDSTEQCKAFDHRTENDSSNEVSVNSSLDLSADRYAHRIYEDIDDRLTIGKISSLPDRSVQPNCGRTVVPKSAAFEARVAALSSLDLVKQPNHQKQLQTVCITSTESDQLADVTSIEADTQVTLPSNKKSSEAVGVDSSKPEKSRRKENGKSFFHKLLRLGSKEGSKEVKDDTVISENSMKVLPTIGDTYENVSCINHEDSLSISVETSGSELICTTTSVCQTRVATSEKQVILLDLKDCLVKRQLTSNKPGSENSSMLVSCPESSASCTQGQVDSLESSTNDQFIKIDKMAALNEITSQELLTCMQEIQPNLACPDPVPTVTIVRTCNEEKPDCNAHQVNLTFVPVDEVKLLTVDTDSSQVTDNFASPCSSSDAVSPTSSDQCAEGAVDHGSRRRSKADMNPSRKLRKPLGAPPPPPPTSPALTSESDSSLVNESCNVKQNMSPTPSVVNSKTKCEMSPLMSHSLPRQGSRKLHDHNVQRADSVRCDEIVTRLNIVAKHSRNKTVSEGIKYDDQLWSNVGLNNKSDEERILEFGGDKRASKFINRALPAPPSAARDTPMKASPVGVSGELCDNLYELVNTPDPATCLLDANGGKMYEDVDDACDDSSDPTSSRWRGRQPSASTQSSPGNKPVVDVDYLEPVLPAEDNKSEWRPSPAPRSYAPPTHTRQNSMKIQATYENCEGDTRGTTISEIPLTTALCFAEMDRITREILRYITDKMYATSLNYMMTESMNLTWSEFELTDGGSHPQLVQNHVSFYQSWHQMLAPNGCVLMVLNKKPAKPLCQHLHLNVLSPIATFRASHLVENGTETVNGGGFDNVAVLPYLNVMRFDDYWRTQHRHVMSGKLQAAHVERAICRTLVHLLSAAIHLNASGWPKPRLDWNHVVMASTLNSSPGEFLPLLRPSTKASVAAADKPGNLFSDVHQLVSIMLEPDVVDTDGDDACSRPLSEPEECVTRPIVRQVDVATFLLTDSPYARCLHRVLRCLQQRAVSSSQWDTCIRESLRLLEFALWGLREGEARLTAVSETRDEDLRSWLALSRCRLLPELVALDNKVADVELVYKARFLCEMSETDMLDATKLLFFDP